MFYNSGGIKNAFDERRIQDYSSDFYFQFKDKICSSILRW